MITDSRVYAFKEELGRDAAADYMRTYHGIYDISFAEAQIPCNIVSDSRKLRGYLKMHWRDCLVADPVPADMYNG